MRRPDGAPGNGRSRPVPLVWREAKAAKETKSAKSDGIPRAGAFCDADESFLKLLSDHGTQRVLMPQDVVVGKGSRRDDLFILVSGEVEVVSHESFVCLLRGPNFFGEATALSLHEASAVTFQAKCVCDVRVLPGQIFRAILQDFPKEQERFQNEAESRAEAVALWKNVWQGVSASRKGGKVAKDHVPESALTAAADAFVPQAWGAADVSLGARDCSVQLHQSTHECLGPASLSTSGLGTPARSSKDAGRSCSNTPRAATPSRQHTFQICNSGLAKFRNQAPSRVAQPSTRVESAGTSTEQHESPLGSSVGLSASQARSVLSQGQVGMHNIGSFSVGSSAPSRPKRPSSATAGRCPVRQPPSSDAIARGAFHNTVATAQTSGIAFPDVPASPPGSKSLAASTEEEELVRKIANGLRSSGKHDLAGEFCAQMGMTDPAAAAGISAPIGVAGRGRGQVRTGRGSGGGRGRCPSPPSREHEISEDSSEGFDPLALSLPSLQIGLFRPDGSDSRPLSPKERGASHASSRDSSALPQCTSSEGSRTPSRPASAAFPSDSQSPLHARVFHRSRGNQRECAAARPLSPASTDTSDTSQDSQICVPATPSDGSRSSLPRTFGGAPSSCSSQTHSPLHTRIMQTLEMPRSEHGTPRSRNQLAPGEEGWQMPPREDVQEVTFCIGKLPSKDTFAQRRAPRPVSPD